MTLSATSMTSAMSMATASATASSGMDVAPNACKISMTWNRYTVGACFISKTWRVSSAGIFGLYCIGVILLVISLEFLQRVQREYQGSIRRKDQNAYALVAVRHPENGASASCEQEADPGTDPGRTTAMLNPPLPTRPLLPKHRSVNPMTLVQRQFVCSLLHMVQFGVAYFIMLLAMYFNGISRLLLLLHRLPYLQHIVAMANNS
ncbi:uncharacterized protein Z519_03459 [Cladophialophora bantiana CBS 173.52]|uniref:Copper transport protein n=1 Tax=Cladophialophora bantiana (strain ATCC 10958 / CBS 173.52 / CDC B-1940 / NIH 8579) TaxID=1442370 RepID=A0A0D2HZN6_CLAB1|nr:uncharacterized protein Z519_03459 [Cladophialophora bantiana CBS 173.52]KIW96390.1 hypothetical protein Z519_03459 [Cladophialophora bantiana CBS 173.52]